MTYGMPHGKDYVPLRRPRMTRKERQRMLAHALRVREVRSIALGRLNQSHFDRAAHFPLLVVWSYALEAVWAVHAAVLAQRRSAVYLPDVALGQLFWGGRRQGWPKNWRSQALDVLTGLVPLRWGQ